MRIGITKSDWRMFAITFISNAASTCGVSRQDTEREPRKKNVMDLVMNDPPWSLSSTLLIEFIDVMSTSVPD